MRRAGRLVLWCTGTALTLLAIAALSTYRHPLFLRDQQVRYHLWRSGVRSGYVQVAGRRIHYLEASPSADLTGIPILLVHGLGARSEDWSPLIPGLTSAGFHVYAPDLLGFGRSAHPDVD